MNKMDWSILRDFIAVAETGGLSQAARRLRVSQPTLSRRIAALEEQLKALDDEQRKALAYEAECLAEWEAEEAEEAEEARLSLQ